MEQHGNDNRQFEKEANVCDMLPVKKEEEEEEEEMTQERIQSLLENIKLEGGLEDQEMTEERVSAILEQVRQAEKDMSSVSGWRKETSSAAGSAGPNSPGAEEGR